MELNTKAKLNKATLRCFDKSELLDDIHQKGGLPTIQRGNGEAIQDKSQQTADNR